MTTRFERRARPRKARVGLRAWFASPPDVREIGGRLRRLLPRLWKDVRIAGALPKLTVVLHPGAPPIEIGLAADGELTVAGDPTAVGPGLCDEAIARLSTILDEIDYGWQPVPESEVQSARDAAGAWLAGELRGGATRIGMPASRAFVIDAAVQTALGPRDAAWRDAVIADPRAAADAFAWWDAGPGQRERSRALLALWHEVPWREPLDRAERATMESVDADLTAAAAADPALALPWAEWAELLDNLGEVERAEAMRARATGPSAIGYRRFDMIAEVGGGWALTLPAVFVGRWEDDGDRYWATDGERAIEVTQFEAAAADSAALLEVAPALHPVIERFTDGDRCGRAEARDDGGSRVLHGLVACAPNVAIVICRSAEADPAWALAIWRSLRRA